VDTGSVGTVITEKMFLHLEVVSHGVWHTSIGELPTVELNVAIGNLLELKKIKIGIRKSVWETTHPDEYDYALMGRDILRFLEIVANGREELLTLRTA
jgi:hypothetical protein